MEHQPGSSRQSADILPRDENQEYEYSKRSGTSGMSGQLYETKLSMLYLHRALHDVNINSFFLGTNMDGIGALDDIILRYSLKGQDRSRVLFVQAKHRDNPKNNPVSVHKDLSLDKCLESFLRIKQKFNAEDTNPIFKKDKSVRVVFELVIYTNAAMNLHKAVQVDSDNILRTTEEGKIFQFKYDNDDIQSLLKTSAKLRIELLAENFARFIFNQPEKYKNMMSDDLIRRYHVILAQEVVEVSKEVFKENNTKQNEHYRKGKFRGDFNSDSSADSNLISIFMKTIYEKAAYSRKICSEEAEIINLVNQLLENPSAERISNLIGNVLTFDAKSNRLKFIETKIPKGMIQLKNDLENKEVTQNTVTMAFEIAGKKTLEHLPINLPSTFGNLDLKLRGNDSKIERRLNHLTSKFIELLRTNEITSNNIVKIDDNMVGPEKMLKVGDIDINGGIGGLVGNLLILDDETKMLKFHNDEESLPKNAKKFLQKLKIKISEDNDLNDLNSYKFEINVNGFPRLSLTNEDYDKYLVKEFLSKLKFYTNQANEEKVEEILKKEIDKHYIGNQKQNKTLFRIKSDVVFLKVHDKVQKWWKQKEKAPYLTKSCKFFEQAKKDIIDNPLLTMLNFMYINSIKKNDIEFNQDAIDTLKLDEFLTGPDNRMLNIITDENILTDIKLVQYFESRNSNDHTFMDLDYVLTYDYYESAISEFEEATLNILIIRYIYGDETKWCQKLKDIINNEFKSSKKFILITKENKTLVRNVKDDFSCQYIEYKDEKNNLINLTPLSQTKLLKKGTVIFQGEEINLDKLIIDQESKYLIDGDVLSKLIKNDKIEIGNVLPDLGEVKHYYINRTFNRPGTIKNDLFATKRSIKESEFADLVHGRKRDGGDAMHWLKTKELIRQQSHGVLSIDDQDKNNSKNNVEKEFVNDKTDNKVFIITAEPGMGKSTVMTSLARIIKECKSSLWVERINLFDLIGKKLNKVDFRKDNAVEYFVNALNFEDKTLGKNIFLHRLKKEGGIILLLDGFDEISPNYKEKVIDLIKLLKETQINRILVSTRGYMQNELEDAFSMRSYTLEPFSLQDQKLFLRKFWQKELNLNKLDVPKILQFTKYSNKLLELFAREDFTGVPLLIEILAKIYESQFQNYLNSKSGELPDYLAEGKFNLITLYGDFIKEKFKRYHLIKRNKNQEEPGTNEEMEELNEIYVNNHKLLAMQLLFSEGKLNLILTDEERSKIQKLIKKIRLGNEKTGFVNNVIGDKPIFIHLSFAEYFAAKLICDKLKSAFSRHSLYRVLAKSATKLVISFVLDISNIIWTPEFIWEVAKCPNRRDLLDFNVCDDNVFTALHYACMLEDIDNFNYNVMYFLINYTTNVNFTNKKGNTALHILCESGKNNTTREQLIFVISIIFILKGVKKETKNGDDKTAADLAREHKLEHVAELLETTTPNNIPHIAAKWRLFDIVRNMFENKLRLNWLDKVYFYFNVNEKDAFGCTVLHVLCGLEVQPYIEEAIFITVAELVLKKGATVNIKNNNGKTAEDVARDCGRQDLAEFLKSPDINSLIHYKYKNEIGHFQFTQSYNSAHVNDRDESGHTLLYTVCNLVPSKNRLVERSIKKFVINLVRRYNAVVDDEVISAARDCERNDLADILNENKMIAEKTPGYYIYTNSVYTNKIRHFQFMHSYNSEHVNEGNEFGDTLLYTVCNLEPSGDRFVDRSILRFAMDLIVKYNAEVDLSVLFATHRRYLHPDHRCDHCWNHCWDDERYDRYESLTDDVKDTLEKADSVWTDRAISRDDSDSE